MIVRARVTCARGLAALSVQNRLLEMLPSASSIAFEQIVSTAYVHPCPTSRVGNALDHRGGLIGVVP